MTESIFGDESAIDVRESVEFFVPGLPVTQGSKNQFGFEVNLKALKAWRRDVAMVALSARPTTWRPHLGDRPPVRLTAVFALERPHSHLGKEIVEVDRVPRRAFGGKAPTRPIAKPDLDKLMRAIGDALAMQKRKRGEPPPAPGVLWHDDSEIVEERLFKAYGQQVSGVFLRAERLWVGRLPLDIERMVVRQGFDVYRADLVRRPCSR